MRPRATILLAGREVREALRSRWFWLAAGGFLILSLGVSLLGLAGAQRSGLAGFDRTTAGLLNLQLLFVPLVALALGSQAIAGELEDGALGALLAQPVTRAEVFAGKYLGLFAALGGAVVAGFGATGVLVGLIAGGQAGPFLALLANALLLTATTLALAMLLSAAFPSRGRVAGAAFFAWLLLVYLSDLGTIGLVLARDLAPAQVCALAAVNPLQVARVLGTLALTGRPEVLGPVGLFAVDQFGATGSIFVLLGAAVACAAVPLFAGYALFRKAVLS